MRSTEGLRSHLQADERETKARSSIVRQCECQSQAPEVRSQVCHSVVTLGEFLRCHPAFLTCSRLHIPWSGDVKAKSTDRQAGDRFLPCLCFTHSRTFSLGGSLLCSLVSTVQAQCPQEGI